MFQGPISMMPTKAQLLEGACYIILMATVAKVVIHELHLAKAWKLIAQAICNTPLDAIKILVWIVVAFYLGLATHGWLANRSQQAPTEQTAINSTQTTSQEDLYAPAGTSDQ